MLRTNPRLAFVGLSLTLGAASVAAAPDGYSITDLGTLPGKANSWVWQQTINEGGVIPAYANDIDNPNAFFGDVPFLWKRGKITVLPELPGAIDTIPYSLNESGQVVGSSQPDGEGPHAVLWDRTQGVSWRIGILGELPGDNFSFAYAINNHHQAVGSSARFTPDPFSLEYHAVLWKEKEGIVPLPPLPDGGVADFALDINERGQIVGFSGPAFGSEHAALWDNGGVTDLGLIGGEWAQAIALNNKVQVVGYAQTADAEVHAFSWEADVMSDLGVLSPLHVFSGAFDVNQKGQIVGMSGASPVDVATSHAVLWDDGVITDLQTLIPADSGWTLLAALGINERGQISGFGIHEGRYRAFLLTPMK